MRTSGDEPTVLLIFCCFLASYLTASVAMLAAQADLQPCLSEVAQPPYGSSAWRDQTRSCPHCLCYPARLPVEKHLHSFGMPPACSVGQGRLTIIGFAYQLSAPLCQGTGNSISTVIRRRRDQRRSAVGACFINIRPFVKQEAYNIYMVVHGACLRISAVAPKVFIKTLSIRCWRHYPARITWTMPVWP